jgi:hypothetical protein
MRKLCLVLLLLLAIVANRSDEGQDQIVAKAASNLTRSHAIVYLDDNNVDDVGASINQAYALLPSTGGTIIVPPGQFRMSTAVNLNTTGKLALIQCSPGDATTLTWSRPSGIAVTIDARANTNQHPVGYGVRDCTLAAAGSSDATAVMLGATNSAEGAVLENVKITGFRIGISVPTGSNISFQNTFRNVSLFSNLTGISIGSGVENTHIYGGFISSNQTGIRIADNSDVYAYSVSFDDNALWGVDNSGSFSCFGCHAENPGLGATNYLQSSGVLTLYGGEFLDDVTEGTVLRWINVTGGFADISSLHIYSAGRTATQIINIAGHPRLNVSVQNNSSITLPTLYSAAGYVNLDTTDGIRSAAYFTTSNCISLSSPAACGSASAGAVALAVGSTTEIVNTTVVTDHSRIFLMSDASLGGELGIHCNSVPIQPTVSARTKGKGFTIRVPIAPKTNPACFAYEIID